ncbi:MAG: ribonuclease E/G, partial [Bacteroidota bacterium]
FGLIQITRQRVRPELSVITTEKCPTCKGTGEITASVALLEEIEQKIRYLFHNLNHTQIMLEVHPYVAAFIKRGLFKSIRWSWLYKYKRWVGIKAASTMQFTQYRFLNKNNEEIIL